MYIYNTANTSSSSSFQIITFSKLKTNATKNIQQLWQKWQAHARHFLSMTLYTRVLEICAIQSTGSIELRNLWHSTNFWVISIIVGIFPSVGIVYIVGIIALLGLTQVQVYTTGHGRDCKCLQGHVILHINVPNVKYFLSTFFFFPFFVSPERDYVITDSVRSMYVVCTLGWFTKNQILSFWPLHLSFCLF